MRSGRAATAWLLAMSAGMAVQPAGAGMEMPAATCAPEGTVVVLRAEHNQFDRDCVAVPAGEAFTVVFDNRDSAPHNVAILAGHDSTEALLRGDLVTGPESVRYAAGALPAGAYHFHCEVHRSLMMGSFVVGEGDAETSMAGMAMPSSGGGVTMAEMMPRSTCSS